MKAASEGSARPRQHSRRITTVKLSRFTGRQRPEARLCSTDLRLTARIRPKTHLHATVTMSLLTLIELKYVKISTQMTYQWAAGKGWTPGDHGLNGNDASELLELDKAFSPGIHIYIELFRSSMAKQTSS